jgi:hypothetical protein
MASDGMPTMKRRSPAAGAQKRSWPMALYRTACTKSVEKFSRDIRPQFRGPPSCSSTAHQRQGVLHRMIGPQPLDGLDRIGITQPDRTQGGSQTRPRNPTASSGLAVSPPGSVRR